MNKILKILEPTMLPSDTSSTPAMDADILTAASGNEVPNATTVNPMTKLDTLKNFAIDDAPSTNKSAPLTSKTKPNTKK